MFVAIWRGSLTCRLWTLVVRLWSVAASGSLVVRALRRAWRSVLAAVHGSWFLALPSGLTRPLHAQGESLSVQAVARPYLWVRRTIGEGSVGRAARAIGGAPRTSLLAGAGWAGLVGGALLAGAVGRLAAAALEGPATLSAALAVGRGPGSGRRLLPRGVRPSPDGGWQLPRTVGRRPGGGCRTDRPVGRFAAGWERALVAHGRSEPIVIRPLVVPHRRVLGRSRPGRRRGRYGRDGRGRGLARGGGRRRGRGRWLSRPLLARESARAARCLPLGQLGRAAGPGGDSVRRRGRRSAAARFARGVGRRSGGDLVHRTATHPHRRSLCCARSSPPSGRWWSTAFRTWWPSTRCASPSNRCSSSSSATCCPATAAGPVGWSRPCWSRACSLRCTASFSTSPTPPCPRVGSTSPRPSIGTRAYSIIQNPNGLGAYLLLGSFVAGSLALAPLGRRLRLVAGAVTVVLLACLAVTFSRGAWIGFAVGCFGFVALARPRMFLGLVIAAVVAPFVAPGKFLDRLTFAFSQTYLTKSLAAGRLYSWALAVTHVEAAPVVRCGPGNVRRVDRLPLQVHAHLGRQLLPAARRPREDSCCWASSSGCCGASRRDWWSVSDRCRIRSPRRSSAACSAASWRSAWPTSPPASGRPWWWAWVSGS